MNRSRVVTLPARLVLAGFLLAAFASIVRAEEGPEAPVSPSASGEAGFPGSEWLDLAYVKQKVFLGVSAAARWYARTPPGERMAWGGLAACAVLGASVFGERSLRLRRRGIIPNEFTAKFLDRLHGGKLDSGKALDYCEMNPSPAARVALGAVRRWGRPAVDLERAVEMAHRVEAEQLRRNVGTLRRIAAIAPLLGLLGTLLGTSRVLADPSREVAAFAATLSPLIFGVTLAILALVAYDVLAVKIERLAGALDLLGAETIDAIAMTAPPPPVSMVPTASAPPTPRTRTAEPHPAHAPPTPGANRAPHSPATAAVVAAHRPAEPSSFRVSTGDHDIGY